MELILLSRDFHAPNALTLRVSLLQDVDTMRQRWEVRGWFTRPNGGTYGQTTTKRTRSEAMRIVRHYFHPASR